MGDNKPVPLRPLRLDRGSHRSPLHRGLRELPARDAPRAVAPHRENPPNDGVAFDALADLSEALAKLEAALGGTLTHKLNCRPTGYECSCGLRGFNRYVGRE